MCIRDREWEAEACVVCLSGIEGVENERITGVRPNTDLEFAGIIDSLTVYGCFSWSFTAKRNRNGTFTMTRTAPKVTQGNSSAWREVGDHTVITSTGIGGA